METRSTMFNYVTREYEPIGDLFALSDDKLKEFLPDAFGMDVGARMFDCYVALGWTREDAFLKVLHKSIGEDYEPRKAVNS